MTKYEKASFVINLKQGVDTWVNDDSVYISVWNAELSDTFDICIHESEVDYYAKEYDNIGTLEWGKKHIVNKYARKCSITGQGMNSGYVIGEGEMYIKEMKDLIKHLRKVESEGNPEYKKDISEGRLTDVYLVKDYYESGYYYFTEWEDENDYQWVEYRGHDGKNQPLVEVS